MVRGFLRFWRLIQPTMGRVLTLTALSDRPRGIIYRPLPGRTLHARGAARLPWVLLGSRDASTSIRPARQRRSERLVDNPVGARDHVDRPVTGEVGACSNDQICPRNFEMALRPQVRNGIGSRVAGGRVYPTMTRENPW